MKVGDLVQINSAGRNVIWTEPFRNSVGIITKERHQWYERGEFKIMWTNVLKEGDCSKTFLNKYWWKYKSLLVDWVPRSYLKHAKGKN